MNQRHPVQTPNCAITVHVTLRVFEGLVSKARSVGMTASTYAGLLFHAGYAARCGKAADDPELAAVVDRVVARLEAVRSRPAPPITPQPKVTVAAEPLRPVVVREAVAVPVPVLIPVPIALPFPVRAEPLAVHISGSHPITEEAHEHLAALIGAAVTKFETADSVPSPSRARLALNRSIRALAACGNDADEIAEALGCTTEEILEALGSDA